MEGLNSPQRFYPDRNQFVLLRQEQIGTVVPSDWIERIKSLAGRAIKREMAVSKVTSEKARGLLMEEKAMPTRFFSKGRIAVALCFNFFDKKIYWVEANGLHEKFEANHKGKPTESRPLLTRVKKGGFKTTEQQIREMVLLRKQGLKIKDIAEKIGVSISTVSILIKKQAQKKR